MSTIEQPTNTVTQKRDNSVLGATSTALARLWPPSPFPRATGRHHWAGDPVQHSVDELRMRLAATS